MTVISNLNDPLTTATEAGLARNLGPSPLIGLSPAEVAQKLGDPANRHFVIVDERSAKDDTVLLVHTVYWDEEGNPVTYQEGEVPRVQTVRATFVSAQATLVALEMATLGIEELQSMAEGSPGGVYGPDRIPDYSEGPRQGGEAPAKLLSNSE